MASASASCCLCSSRAISGNGGALRDTQIVTGLPSTSGTIVCAARNPVREGEIGRDLKERGRRLSLSSSSGAFGRSGALWKGRARKVRASGGGDGEARAMFTGIVEEMGTVRDLRQVESGGYEMSVEGGVVLEDVKLGDSIAVNGTCLTVIRFDESSFDVGLAPETLRKTSLGEVEKGTRVNLERSVQPSTRMGGHFVQGHVDGTGTIVSFEPEGDSLWVKIETSPELLRYIVPKGYIAVDGTSLTVVKVLDDESAFTFMLVAYTQQKIVIPLKKVGMKVNLEVDIVGKYVERLLQGYKQPILA